MAPPGAARPCRARRSDLYYCEIAVYSTRPMPRLRTSRPCIARPRRPKFSHGAARCCATLSRKAFRSVLLRDRRLLDAANAKVEDEPALYRAAAAAEILTWRRQVLRDLVAQGVPICTPARSPFIGRGQCQG